MAKIIEISKDKEPNRFGNVTMTIKVELDGEVFAFTHSYPDDFTMLKRAKDFEDYIREEARRQIGMAIMDKFFPNL